MNHAAQNSQKRGPARNGKGLHQQDPPLGLARDHAPDKSQELQPRKVGKNTQNAHSQELRVTAKLNKASNVPERGMAEGSNHRALRKD